MRVLYVVVLVICFLFSCAGKQSEYTKQFVTDPNRRYVTERLSFLPPSGEGWEVFERENQSTSFYYRTVGRNVSISISSFDTDIGINKFKNYTKNNIKGARERQYEIDNNKSKNHNGAILHAAKMKKIKGLNCLNTRVVKRFMARGMEASDGTIEQVTYTCEDPKYPSTLPPIDIFFSQTVAPQLKPWDGDEVLAPILNSLRFLPFDKETSVGYQNYLKQRKKSEEIQKMFDERRKARQHSN